MGGQAFKELWNRKLPNGDRMYDVVLLQRPSETNKKLFAPYEKECGIKGIAGMGCVENGGLKIVWGDATNLDDMKKAVEGVDAVLCPMAFISPEADHNPKQAKAVNTVAIQYLVQAIEEEPDGIDHIRLAYVGTVAATGDRLPPIHWGRIGDPLKPSIFDFYATTKIAGERAVIESKIKHWVVLRQTFIMIPDLLSLQDPIMFHQPINTFMENITSRDAGRGLVNCLDVSADSDFWRRVYNMSGGPKARIQFIDFTLHIFGMLGMDIRKIVDRKWFVLQNFHMQYYEDSAELDKYIHNFHDSIEDYYKQVWDNLSGKMKATAFLNKIFPPMRWIAQKATKKQLRAFAERKDGTLYWYTQKNDQRISAFYGSYEKYEAIPDWDHDLPAGTFGNPEPEHIRLSHGYDETKEQLELGDFQGAAQFRGGRLLSTEWDGDMYSKLLWKCAFDHEFEASPFLILKTGHWCPDCAAPPWNYDEIARKNPFFAKVWYPNHSKDEHHYYDENCYMDILSDEELAKVSK